MAKNSGFSPLNYDIGGKVGSSTFGIDFGSAAMLLLFLAGAAWVVWYVWGQTHGVAR